MAEPEGRAGRHPTGVGRYSGRAVSRTPGARAGVGGRAPGAPASGRRAPCSRARPRPSGPLRASGVGRPARARARRVPCGRRASGADLASGGAALRPRADVSRTLAHPFLRRLPALSKPVFVSLTRLALRHLSFEKATWCAVLSVTILHFLSSQVFGK